MKKMLLALTGAVCAAAAHAATFEGGLFAAWYDEPDECGLWGYSDGLRDSPFWRDDFVMVDGKKEPARFSCDEFAYPVVIEPGETFTPEIVHYSSTPAHFKGVQVLSDAQMFNRYKQSEDEWWVTEIWPNGTTRNTRAWILVQLKTVNSGPTYSLDLSKAPIINDPEAGRFYNPDDEIGGPSSNWTLTSYAKAFGVNLSGIRKLTQSASFDVTIVEEKETFGQRVWSICDPFQNDWDKLEKIDDKGGDDELIDCTGLYFVSADMVSESSGGSTGTVPEAWKKARTLQGVATVGDGVMGVFELKCGKANAKKGTANVSGTLTGLNGKKTKLKAATIDVTGESVTVTWDGLTVKINDDSFETVALPATGLSVDSANVGGTWEERYGTVTVGGVDTSRFPGEVLTDLLPSAEIFSSNGAKWTFSKAAAVKWAKDRSTKEFGLAVDTSKNKTNLSGIRLTYAPKTGVFKGSFKVYALETANGKTKLKKYNFAVTGVVVNGIGHGQATCKKPSATWDVTVG